QRSLLQAHVAGGPQPVFLAANAGSVEGDGRAEVLLDGGIIDLGDDGRARGDDLDLAGESDGPLDLWRFGRRVGIWRTASQCCRPRWGARADDQAPLGLDWLLPRWRFDRGTRHGESSSRLRAEAEHASASGRLGYIAADGDAGELGGEPECAGSACAGAAD